MDGDVPPLPEYAELCNQHGATLVVDEAHAVGIYGARGSGLLEELGVDGGSCLSINTAGKALGVTGAFVAGPAWAIDYIIQRARPFIFTTAAPPAVAAAIGASLDVIAAEPDRRSRLMDRVKRLRAAMAAFSMPLPAAFSQIIPVVVGSNERALDAAGALQAQGFDVRAIRPPSVAPGTARLRISLNVTLSDETIDTFVRALVAVVGAGAIGGVSSGSLSWSAASS
jgi:8-amino-7-oxononanoate synthase